ncbi:MAG: DEAD/DEAH box helicase [Syntrophus sp. (in: bacteria)]
MKLSVGTDIRLTDAPESLLADLRMRLIFENPAFAEAEKWGRWTGSTDKYLFFYREEQGAFCVPRGFAGQLVAIVRQASIQCQLEDNRRTLPDVDFTFAGQLKAFQDQAVKAMLAKDFGTLSAATGSGKTVMACSLIAARRQPTLIIVHTKELLAQWMRMIEQFLGIPQAEIGAIGGGKKEIGRRITVGVINSIYPIAEQIREYFGHIVVDECHRTPSRTFTEAVAAFDSKFMLGLSATPWRRDGLSKVIFLHVGDVQHEVDHAALVDNGDILRAEIITRDTAFSPFSDPQEEYSQMLSELTCDPDRNVLIVQDVLREVANGGGVCLILSDRKTHCEALGSMLRRDGVNPDVLTGNTAARERAAIVARLNAGKVRVLIATGQLIGEGFDAKALQTLFLATPIKFSGRLIQYLGRVLRPAPGKEKAKVYDYVDGKVGVLRASANARGLVYRQICH